MWISVVSLSTLLISVQLFSFSTSLPVQSDDSKQDGVLEAYSELLKILEAQFPSLDKSAEKNIKLEARGGFGRNGRKRRSTTIMDLVKNLDNELNKRAEGRDPDTDLFVPKSEIKQESNQGKLDSLINKLEGIVESLQDHHAKVSDNAPIRPKSSQSNLDLLNKLSALMTHNPQSDEESTSNIRNLAHVLYDEIKVNQVAYKTIKSRLDKLERI